jgi:hypothetical protein
VAHQNNARFTKGLDRFRNNGGESAYTPVRHCLFAAVAMAGKINSGKPEFILKRVDGGVPIASAASPAMNKKDRWPPVSGTGGREGQSGGQGKGIGSHKSPCVVFSMRLFFEQSLLIVNIYIFKTQGWLSVFSLEPGLGSLP